MLQAIRNVDYVILLCQNLGRMRYFYYGTLGFPLYRVLDGWIELRVCGPADPAGTGPRL
jgi:hypothetical protein